MDDCIAIRKELDEFIYNFLYQLTDDADYGHIKYLTKMFFVSLCHHHEYLTKTLHPQSLFRNSTFLCNIPDHMRECVKFSYRWDKTRETPQFTGVPPHVILMSKMRDFNMQQKILQDSLGGLFQSVPYNRKTGSPKFLKKHHGSATLFAA